MDSDDAIKDLQLRVHDLERECTYIKEKNNKHEENYQKVREDLDKLVKVLNQIKWMLIAGAGGFVLSEIGVTAFLKGLVL